MNAHSPHIRFSESTASALESFGGQKVPTETYTKARELRRFIATHAGCTSAEMPADLREHLEFLIRKQLVTQDGRRGPKCRFAVRPL